MPAPNSALALSPLVSLVSLAAFATLACTACSQRSLPPAGQILLYVDTDAPVPPPAGTPDDDVTTVALFDRIRFDLFDGTMPIAQGSQDFAIDSAMFAANRVSIGLIPSGPEGTILARVRLFRGDRVVDGEPPASGTLDTTVEMPPIPVDGIVSVGVILRVDDLGEPLGSLSQPALPQSGPPATSLVGTWPGGQIRPCGSTPAAGLTCVPGGAFWFGDPSFRGRTLHNDIYEERLVTLDPYAIQLHEVTVAEFRAQWPSLAARNVAAPLAWTGPDPTGAVSTDWCTWVEKPGPGDVTGSLPLNCATWPTAEAYCESIGMNLPTEAQLEFASSGVGREWGFPWGDDIPSCGDAIWGQSGDGDLVAYVSDCRAPTALGWMDAPGSGVRDFVGGAVLRTNASEPILDLGGNMAEWALDQWSRADEAYWSTVQVFTNPVADLVSPGDGDAHPVRAGGWLDDADSTRAAFRLFDVTGYNPLGTGFRCAAPGE